MGNVTRSYPVEDGTFDYTSYMEALAQDQYGLLESSVLHVWSPENMDHMRLPNHVDIYSFLAHTIRRLFFRWLHVIGTNARQPLSTDDISTLEAARAYYNTVTFREYMIYHVLLQDMGGPTFPNLRAYLGALHHTGREGVVDLVTQAEVAYDEATYAQRQTWKQEYGTAFSQYLETLNPGGSVENILYTPAYPDIIFTSGSGGSGTATVTNASPHIKIPPSVSYKIRKSAPATSDKIPFGPRKDWKWNDAGEFFDSTKTNVYRLRFRRWENLVEFTTIWRSGAQAEALCILFEQFMNLNERYFQMAGIDKIAPFGRTGEPDVRLDGAGVHYRKSLWYVKTQEFQYYGPITRISGVDVDVVPTSRRDT